MRPVLTELIEIQDRIRDAFGWHLDDDLVSAIGLKNECNNPTTQIQLSGTICIVGAAAQAGITSKYPMIAADGAIGAISDPSQVVLVVSDADGEPYLDIAIDYQIPICLHAHGNNVDRWRAAIDRWPNDHPLILTHQTPNEIEGMYNPGGFTDGDRAICIALALGAENVELVGFSTEIVGKWSGHTDTGLKLIKLQWMKQIIELLGMEVK